MALADSNAVYYYHFDGLGSVVALTDSNGTCVQTYEYSVYGHVAASDPNHPNPFMFTGRQFDIETGLYYYRARYYNPYLGRFLQTDPVGYGYMYCCNNPLSYVDPSGLSATPSGWWPWPIDVSDPESIKKYYEGLGTGLSICFYDDRNPGAWESANDWTRNGKILYFAMRKWQDVIGVLETLKKNDIYVWDVYFHDHCDSLGSDALDLWLCYGLEFGDTHVSVWWFDRFWDLLRLNTPEECQLHLRQCYAGRHRTVLENIARWTHRTVTGCDDIVKDTGIERGESQTLHIPDYDYGGDLWVASPVLKKVKIGPFVLEWVTGVLSSIYWPNNGWSLGTKWQPY